MDLFLSDYKNGSNTNESSRKISKTKAKKILGRNVVKEAEDYFLLGESKDIKLFDLDDDAKVNYFSIAMASLGIHSGIIVKKLKKLRE